MSATAECPECGKQSILSAIDGGKCLECGSTPPARREEDVEALRSFVRLTSSGRPPVECLPAWQALNRIEHDLRHLDPGEHGEDLVAATEMALDDLAEVRAEVARLSEERERLRMWLATDVARARGLAESMTDLPRDFRTEGVEENAAQIVKLLDIEAALAALSPEAGAERETPGEGAVT